MADITAVLEANRAAVSDLIEAAERAPQTWTTPRAPGKWSPSQIVEHVARALEESANVAAGRPSRFPTFPALVRPLVRGIFFNRVIRTNTFPRAKTSKAMDPESGPPTPAEGRRRLETAASQFTADCQARASSGLDVDSGIFGRVSVADFVKFQELHVRHHLAQMPRPD